jgi:hypothetical protein
MKQNSKNDYPGNINYITKLQELKQHEAMGIENLSKLQLDAAARALQQQQ